MQLDDPMALNLWYVVAAECELRSGLPWRQRLLGYAITVLRTRHSALEAWLGDSATGSRLPCVVKFGYVWTSLGRPARDIFDIPEYDEPSRRNMNAASVGLHASAPRAVENFLDMSHFAFVHTGYLGIEPHTEVKPYRVSVSSDGHEILATQCRAFQPVASLAAAGGTDVEYIYRIPHPYCALLYKAVETQPGRQDVIGLFLQPVSEERCVAHMLVSVLDDDNSIAAIRRFQQFIFSQDKPILENQIPKRLPLDPRSEISARADAGSSSYRRWLRQRGHRYGTVSA